MPTMIAGPDQVGPIPVGSPLVMKSQLIALTPWLTTAQMTITSTATAATAAAIARPWANRLTSMAAAQVAGRDQRLGRIELLRPGAGGRASSHRPPGAPKRWPTQLASRLAGCR